MESQDRNDRDSPEFRNQLRGSTHDRQPELRYHSHESLPPLDEGNLEGREFDTFAQAIAMKAGS